MEVRGQEVTRSGEEDTASLEWVGQSHVRLTAAN